MRVRLTALGLWLIAGTACGSRTSLLAGDGGAGGFGAGGAGGALVCPLRDVVAGGHHTCARIESRAHCWGANQFGQVGDASAVDRERPTRVEGLFDVRALGSGDFHSCALLESGDVRCWGHNALGALGDGTYQDSAVPTQVKLLSDAVALSQNAVTLHTCAVVAGGDVACWGDNSHLQLGGGTTAPDSNRASPVVGIHDAVSVATGYLFSCAVLENAEVRCWGWNANGALGLGNEDGQVYLPSDEVVGVGDGAQVVAGNHYACVRRTTGIVSCWGYNGSGQLGIGELTFTSLPVAAPIVGVHDAIFIAGGESHACAVRQDGRVMCWGRNFYGQLGDGTTVDRAEPVFVEGIDDATRVAAGGDHTCAESASRGLVCWGANFRGQLGDGTFADALSPVSVVCPTH